MFERKKRPSRLNAQRQQRFQSGVTFTDRLFLALLPDLETAMRLGDLAGRLKIGHGLTGKPLETEHFHVALCHIGDFAGLPPHLIDAVADRVASVAMPRFRVAFDRVGSFGGDAFVLSGDDGTIGLDILQQRLSDALDGSPQRARPFTPHLTLLRDRQRIPEQPIEPIGWTASEVVLVHSLLGKTAHHQVARFPLH